MARFKRAFGNEDALTFCSIMELDGRPGFLADSFSLCMLDGAQSLVSGKIFVLLVHQFDLVSRRHARVSNHMMLLPPRIDLIEAVDVV